MPSSCPHCASLRAPRCQRRSWLRANFSQPMKVEELAELVHMSVSSIKSVTSMSPLQCQKVLRLQEARRLMPSTMMDAGFASHRVGYLSASQFSREYSRFFGECANQGHGQIAPRHSTSGVTELRALA